MPRPGFLISPIMRKFLLRFSASGGASVSLEMWDGYWLIIAMIAALVPVSYYGERAK